MLINLGPWLIAACALTSMISSAQAADESEQLETVTITASKLGLETPSSTGSRLDITPMETPASIQIISGDSIREVGDITVQEALSRAAGIVDQGSSGNGGLGLSARGFSGVNSVMRLYDGLQMVVAAGTMTFPFDTWTVERIEILGGPASVMYGSGAIGGVVNVVPKVPNTMMREHVLYAAAGNYNTDRLAFDATGPISDKLSYRLTAARSTSEGWVPRGESSSLAVSGVLRYRFSDDFSLSLSHDMGDQQPATNSSTPVPNGVFDERLRFVNYAFVNAERYYKDHWTQLKADWQIAPSVNLKSTAFYLTADRLWFGSGTPTYRSATNDFIITQSTDLSHDLKQHGLNVTAVIDAPIWERDNAFSIGADTFSSVFDHVYWITNPNYVIDYFGTNPGRFVHDPGYYSYINEFWADQYGVFAEDRFEIAPKLAAVVGLRYDHYEVERHEKLTGVRSAANFNALSWRVGTVYDLTENLALYASYSTATDPPGSIGNMTASAQLMEMMEGTQYEIGAKQAFAGGRGEWTLAAYHIVKKNLTTTLPEQPGVTQQIGQQSSQGIEAAIAFDFTSSLNVAFNGSILDAKYDDFYEAASGVSISRVGNTPSNIAEKTANATLMWSFLPEWKARASARYVGPRYADNANSRELESYTVVDAGMRWGALKNLSLDLRVSNVFDLIYAPNSTSATAWTLGAPRTYTLSANTFF